MVKKNINLCCVEAYDAPAVRVIDIQNEGVLCESGVGIEDWEKDDEILDF